MDCVVPGCTTKRNVQRHCFPVNMKVGGQWLKAIGSDKLLKLTYQEICRRQYWVCYKRFREDLWITTFIRPRLKDSAIPSLIVTPTALFSYPKEMYLDVDHVYPKRVQYKGPRSDLSSRLRYTKSPVRKNISIDKSSLSFAENTNKTSRIILEEFPECGKNLLREVTLNYWKKIWV